MLQHANIHACVSCLYVTVIFRPCSPCKLMVSQEVLSEAKQLIVEKARAAGMGGAVAESKWRDTKASPAPAAFF